MMTGHVSSLRVLLSIPFRRPNQPDIAIEFAVDTGFNGFLSLPASAVAALGLPFRYDLRARLADDSETILPVHDAVILWHGVELPVLVLATGRRPLLGTALLDGAEFFARFEENGSVTAKKIA